MKLNFNRIKPAYRKRARTRSSMRGYTILETSDRLDFVIQLKDAIANTPLRSVNNNASPFFFGAGIADAERILRQFLVTRVLSYDFNLKVLTAFGNGSLRVVHPLPAEWRKVVEQHGLTADTGWNKIIWNWRVFMFFLFGLTVFLRSLFYNLKEIFVPSLSKHKDRHVYFEGLTAKNLPQPGVQTNSYDIFSWYEQWKGRPRNITALHHSIPAEEQTAVNGMQIVGVHSAIAPFGSIKLVVKYFCWGVVAFFLAIIDLFRSRYWHALLFGEAAKSAQMRLLSNERLADDYLFPNSHWIYRPLWTYEAEKKGSQITFYFYSTNIESFKKADGYGLQAYTWQIINWPRYLVWDDWQADFVRRAVGNEKNIEVVGSIWFLPGTTQQLTIPRNSVAVFDINPLRDTRYHMFVESPKYLVPSVVNQFLLDIYEVLNNKGLTMVLKRKREIGSMLNKKNRKVVDQLLLADHFLAVDMDIPAHQLIGDCCMVISLPFTSTALIARDLGKPSCFYDPSGLVQPDDRAAHGICIVRGKEELASWVSSVMEQQQSYRGNVLKDQSIQ